MKPMVSICIPTYNRAEQLQETLESIVSQREFMEGKVEIAISDNASEDDTERMGKEYAKKFQNILYFRNEENVRDKNFPLALSRGNGILRKLNNDTFCLRKNALSVLCALVDKYCESRPCIFLSNGQGRCGNEKMLDFREFVMREGHYVTWIGGFTAWEEQCRGIAEDVTGCELSLWQVRKLYDMVYATGKAVVCDTQIGVSISPARKDLSYGLYQVFYVNFLGLISPYVKNGALEQGDLEIIKKNLLIYFFTDWIIKWEMESAGLQYSESENLKELVFAAYRDKPYWKRYQRIYRRRYICFRGMQFLENCKNKVSGRKL